MAHISTRARKFRKLTRKTISERMYHMTHQQNKWRFFNPVENKEVELTPIGIESMLYSMVPAVRDAEFKYGQGVARLLLSHSEIETNYRSASELNEIVKIIASAHQHEWDPDLRGLSIRELKDFFHNESKCLDSDDRETLASLNFVPNNAYEVRLIKNFDEATKYQGYTTWCITSSSGMWDSYSANGMNNIYFILKKGYEDIKPVNNGTSGDEYSTSMISVIVRPFGTLAFCTGRYNHSNGGNDALLNVREISELIGANFYDVFKPKEGKELEDVIFQSWTEVEPDTICYAKGWKRLKKNSEIRNGWIEQEKYTYYDPEMLYIVFDSVGVPDAYGNMIVELNHKYNLINSKGDLLL